MNTVRNGCTLRASSSGAAAPAYTNRALLMACCWVLLAAAWPINVAAAPYKGTPIAVPGTFEAEDFDTGGEGVGYHDSGAGNAGGQYRPAENVDIIVSRDSAGGGYVVNNFRTGEWLAYTINVGATDRYDVELRVASAFSNSAFHIEIDGVNVTGRVAVPNTSSWRSFRWVGRRGIQLTAGQHVMKIVSDQQYFDLNSVRIIATPNSTPYLGSPIALPGSFEAENFDVGGEGVAYHDNSPGNTGGQYRSAEGVDIIASADPAGGGYVVSSFESGEWINYTVNVAAAGRYDIDLRVSSAAAGGAFHVEIDGVDVTGAVAVPATGGASAFQWVGRKGVALAAGQRVLTIVADQPSFDLNSVRVIPTATTPYGGAPIALPGTFEAENFDIGGEGISYHDNVTGNAGGQFRPAEDVDIVASTDSLGGGYVVNNFETGEWLLYTVNVAAAGQYDIELRASSMFANSAFRVEIDGVDVTGTIVVPNTGSWNAFQWVGKKGVTLAAGTHLLKVVSNQQYFNLNSIRVAPPAPAEAPPPVDPGTVLFSCTFASAPNECGFGVQQKVAGRATIVSTGRDGATGVRLHTEPGDTNVAGSGTSERNDLALSVADTDGFQGREHWWAHSVLFPSDFASPPSGWGVALDFHNASPGGGQAGGQANFHLDTSRWDGETLHFRGYGGVLASSSDAPGEYHVTIGPIVKNVWYDFVYHVKWSSGPDGFFHAWVNGVKKLAHNGPTLYRWNGVDQQVYLKVANYHSAFGQPSSVIHDRIIRGTSPLAVALGPLEGVLELVDGILRPLPGF